jgi:hypothetical protein
MQNAALVSLKTDCAYSYHYLKGLIFICVAGGEEPNFNVLKSYLENDR